MALITEEYQELQTEAHKQHKGYGTTAQHYLRQVAAMVPREARRTLLDYGCGKGTLKIGLKVLRPSCEVIEYDPGIPDKGEFLKDGKLVLKGDYLTCIDVLEHIEPDCLTEVLEDIATLFTEKALVTVCTRPAKKTLPDGRNFHINLHPLDWWRHKLYLHFTIESYEQGKEPDEWVFILSHLPRHE